MDLEWTFGVSVDDYITDATGTRRYQPPTSVTTTWAEYTDFLVACAGIERDPIEKAGDPNADPPIHGVVPWTAPFVLRPGATRRRDDDVSHIGAYIAIDLDIGNWSLPNLKAKLAGVTCILHTTTQAVPDAMRWRIAVRTSRPYTKDEFPRIWSGVNHLFDDCCDYPTRNPSRISFVPATWAGAANVFYQQQGAVLDIDDVLAAIPAPQPREKIDLGNITLTHAPDGLPIISNAMIARVAAEPVGRRFFRMLCAAATRHRRMGWALSPMELGAAGLLAAESFSPGKQRSDALREAERAIKWAEQHHVPMTPLEKIRERIAREQQYRYGRR